MNCPDWEERIAAGEAAEVEQHLAECAECRDFAEGVRQSLELLRGVHAEPIAPAHFAAVRARVLAQLEKEQRRRWRLVWVGGLAAVAVLVLFFLIPRQPRIAIAPPPLPPVAAQYPMQNRNRQGADAADQAVVTPLKRAKRVRQKPKAPPAEPLMVKLITDDPDIVIYWIAN